MAKLLDSVIQKITWKKTVLFVLLFAVLYAVINFSAIGVVGLLSVTNGANILDFEFGYTYEKAYNMLTALGADGRDFYLKKILPLDFPFPFSYMLFYVGLIALMIKPVMSQKMRVYLLLIPILAMLCDWTENIAIMAMLDTYPDLPELAVTLASTCAMLKTIFIIGSFAIIGILFIIFVFLKFTKNKH